MRDPSLWMDRCATNIEKTSALTSIMLSISDFVWGQPRDIVSPTTPTHSGSPWGHFWAGRVGNTFLGGIWNSCPSHPSWLLLMWRNKCVSHPLSQGAQCHPGEAACICNLVSLVTNPSLTLPNVLDYKWEWKRGLTSKWRALLFDSTLSWPQQSRTLSAVQ